jgi:uncharacterized membrane protein (DUF106 family)
MSAMDFFNAFLNSSYRLFFGAFSWAPPLLSLAVMAVLVGVAMLWGFRKTSDQAAMKRVKRKIYASLLELRVFADEPAVSWRAQQSLFIANLRYMGLALKPALVMSIPIALLLLRMEAFYGRAPLPVGREAVVTLGMRAPLDAQAPVPALIAPIGVSVESQPVRLPDERQVSWRIRPTREASGQLQFMVDGKPVYKTLETGKTQRFVPGRSVTSGLTSLWNPDEPGLKSEHVEWIEIRYPSASIGLFGLQLNWLVWFLLISMLTALILKKRFGVVF